MLSSILTFTLQEREEKREREKVVEVISEALIAEKISKLEKERDIQGQETESQTG